MDHKRQFIHRFILLILWLMKLRNNPMIFHDSKVQQSGYPVCSANYSIPPLVIPACRWAGIHRRLGQAQK